MRDGAGGDLGYGVAARIFHWLAVLLIFVTIPVGFVMTQGLPRSVQDPLFALHKTIGVTLLILMLARLAWRIGHGAPPPAPMPRAQVGSGRTRTRRRAGATAGRMTAAGIGIREDNTEITMNTSRFIPHLFEEE